MLNHYKYFIIIKLSTDHRFFAGAVLVVQRSVLYVHFELLRIIIIYKIEKTKFDLILILNMSLQYTFEL